MHNKWWGILFGVVLLVEGIAVLISPIMGWWLPKSISSYGGSVDMLFYIILAITGVFFVLTEVVLVWNMWRSSTQRQERAPYVHGNHKLELIWTVVPGALLMLLAIVQINVWADIKYQSRMPAPDKTVQQVEVTARQWEWRLRYPSSQRMAGWDAGKDDYKYFGTKGFEDKGQADDVHLVNELHVVQGTKVLIHLKTRDVIHSFFLPHVRLKQDALPGKTIPVWFQIENREGKNYNCSLNPETKKWEDGFDPASGKFSTNDQIWELACAEYCGSRHSLMRGKMYVHKDKDDFVNWLKSVEEANRPPH